MKSRIFIRILVKSFQLYFNNSSYGFIDKCIDAIQLNIDSVNINIKSNFLTANLNVNINIYQNVFFKYFRIMYSNNEFFIDFEYLYIQYDATLEAGFRYSNDPSKGHRSR